MTLREPPRSSDRQPDDPELAESPLSPRRPLGQPRDHWLDEIIRNAQAAGHFDNLPGQGKPLPKADPYEPLDDWWMAHHVLKQAGFLPDWLQLRKEVFEERPSVVAALDEYHRYRAAHDAGDPAFAEVLRRLADRYVALAREINKKFDEHNLRRPPRAPELIRFQEDALER